MNNESLVREIETRLSDIAQSVDTAIDFLKPNSTIAQSERNRDLIIIGLNSAHRKISEAKTVISNMR